jgi:hypothetical protein
VLAAVAAAIAPAPSRAQRTDEEWLQSCRERRERDDRVRYCDVRVERLQPPGGAIRVDPGGNGGVSFEGWDQNQVEVHARVEARAASEADARALAERVRLITTGTIRAEGPANEGDSNWHVSYVVYVPAQSDVEAVTQNGPLGVRGVAGGIRLETRNGPISLRDVGGDVHARTQNGPIAVTLTGTTWQGAGLDAETRNGPISLSIPDGYNARLETGTVHGPFSSDLPLTVTLQGRLSGPFTATLGNGGPPIRLVTTNGPVSIKRS